MTDPDYTVEEECKNIDIVLVDRLTVKQRAFYRDEFSTMDVYTNLEPDDKPKAVSLTRYRESKCLCSRFRLDGYKIQVALARKAEDYQECSFEKHWPSDLENFYTSNLVYNLETREIEEKTVTARSNFDLCCQLDQKLTVKNKPNPTVMMKAVN